MTLYQSHFTVSGSTQRHECHGVCSDSVIIWNQCLFVKISQYGLPVGSTPIWATGSYPHLVQMMLVQMMLVQMGIVQMGVDRYDFRVQMF